MGRLRVLQFITPSGFYGAERWVLALANNFGESDIVCDLAVTDEGAGQDLSIAEYYPKDVGKVHRLKMTNRFDLNVIQQLEKVIFENDIDVIHTHGYKSDILGLIAARKTRIKCVSTPHGFSKNIGFKLALFIGLGKFSLRFFDAVVPLSEELMRDMKDIRVKAEKLYFIRNGVDINEIDRAISNEAVIQRKDNKKKRVGFIGQLIPRKGLTDLLQVFDMLHSSNDRVQLQLVGDGVQREELEAYANSLKCSEEIEFLGFREDRLSLLKGFDLFLMTSSLEGIPRCLMEAMAMGVPIVAYDIPGVDQLIENEVTGLLAPLGDKNKLADQCLRIFDDAELRSSIIQAARERLENDYSAERMAQEYMKIYEKLTYRSEYTNKSRGQS